MIVSEKLGIVMIEEALDKAKAKNIDLVQVPPYGANPTVCKLLDYGKFQFEKKKIKGRETEKTVLERD